MLMTMELRKSKSPCLLTGLNVYRSVILCFGLVVSFCMRASYRMHSMACTSSSFETGTHTRPVNVITL